MSRREQEGAELVSFFCQNCVKPIKFEEKSEDKIVELAKNTLNISLENIQAKEIYDKNPKYHIIEHIFDIISSQSQIDHPLCTNCSDCLIDAMHSQLLQYKESIESLFFLEQHLKESQSNHLDRWTNKLIEMSLSNECLLFELNYTISEALSINNRNLKSFLCIHLNQIQLVKHHLQQEYDKSRSKLIAIEKERRSLNNQINLLSSQTDYLKSNNIFSLAFNIGRMGPYGVINGFRLGRLASNQVEWREIDSAWGQIILLTCALAKKMEYVFERFTPVAYGNLSYMISLIDNKHLPLYFQSGIRFFWDCKFDQAMIAYFDCFKQITVKLEEKQKSFVFPYKMDGGHFIDKNNMKYSIKTQGNSDENWTIAMRYMLCNLKYACSYVSVYN